MCEDDAYTNTGWAIVNFGNNPELSINGLDKFLKKLQK